MFISACSYIVTDSEDKSLVKKSEYGELPNKLNDEQTKMKYLPNNLKKEPLVETLIDGNIDVVEIIKEILQ